jgi:DNA invertase Pin-like site-specific DNA recombinase
MHSPLGGPRNDPPRERGFLERLSRPARQHPGTRIVWQMIGVLAELERSLISERTRAGVKDAQRRGVKIRVQVETDAVAD